MRLRDPKTTALIFGSGKNALVTPLYWIALQIVITGGISEESCRLAARKFTRVIKVGSDNVHGLRMFSIGMMLSI
ncbi:hypothetical protein PsorP6_010187 [Peronosclerospora sorghi]|uniref:Uncharacterized protein n=1 Tax=Peronosclerospora sorghi TaxID=230839 RepID=A0ACC0VXZ0_9STRA|nr:hypothetical protein PsorP6_010187 [Peronosclerospora sorghi]